MDQEELTTIHPSLTRPVLLLGCDRELLLVAGLLCALLIFALMKWWSVVTGTTLWLVCLCALSIMAKADPLMRHVYLRHLKYRTYYPAKSRPMSAGTVVLRSWR